MHPNEIVHRGNDELQKSQEDSLQTFPDFTTDKLLEMKTMKRRNSGVSSTQIGSSTRVSSSFTPSSGTSGIVGKHNIWSTMTRRGYMAKSKDAYHYEDIDTEFVEEHSWIEDIKFFFSGCAFETMYRLRTLSKLPRIMIYSLLVFLALTAGALGTINVICKNMQQKIELNASLEAFQTASWFADMFAKTLIPLRSLQQAIIHSDTFKNLPHQVGNYGVEGSASSVFGPKSTNIKDYRNVTGICDNQDMIQEFQSIVNGINRNFDFEDIIITYRLAPYGVYCLADPMMVNFVSDDVVSLNSVIEIGWDPIRSSSTKMGSMLRSIYHQENTIAMFGPSEAFLGIPGLNMYCGHLAVEMPGYNYVIDGEEKSIWGFVMHFIDWSRLKSRSGIDEYYREKGYSYHLTRTDLVADPETGEASYKNVIIAQSQEWPVGHKFYSSNQEPFDDVNSIVISVNTLDSGDWTMRVKTHVDVKSDLFYVNVLSCIGTFIVSCMFAMNLTEKALHKMLLYKMMPMDAIQKLNRGQTVVERYNIVTIFFSDIVGFTSLCGDMRPIQVMKMLNELYMEFDKIVEKHGVYKVETIGDAYMVVGGAPHRIPAPEAAEKVALFALEAMEFVKNFKTAEDDESIFIRAGVASGPVVAGVVGKAMPRYCFFGDTVNLASRMESNSKSMKIQCSDFTNRLLRDAPTFDFCLDKREGMVHLKGKGMTQTWWIQSINGPASTTFQIGDVESQPINQVANTVIQSMALSKQAWECVGQPDSSLVSATSNKSTMVYRIFSILEYRLSIAMKDRGQKPLTYTLKNELHSYVQNILSMYNNVHFHGIEHASHVTISMHKLIDSLGESAKRSSLRRIEMMEDSETTDIIHNSFTHFALVFACVIHDVEHTGKSNKILNTTRHKITRKYSWSEAEHNSVHVAIQLLSCRKYKDLLNAICPSTNDRDLFIQKVLWAILSTDIASTERLNGCIARFNEAYSSQVGDLFTVDLHNIPQASPNGAETRRGSMRSFNAVTKYLKIGHYYVRNLHDEDIESTDNGSKGRAAIEHLMQVADIAHIMQNWENFLKWNLRMYKELMDCHKNGLIPDPSSGWSEVQIEFIVNYVIPLACRTNIVFDDNLSMLNLTNNAQANLSRWINEGDIIAGIFVSGYQGNDSENDILLECLSQELLMEDE